MLWCGVLMVAVIAGGVCLLIIRRKFGPGASIPNLQEPISSMLEMETRLLAPAELHPCAPAIVNEAANPGLTIAAGLAGFQE